MLKNKEMLLVKSVLISEEPSFPAKFGGEAEEDLGVRGPGPDRVFTGEAGRGGVRNYTNSAGGVCPR